MEHKFFTILDLCTSIPALAIKFHPHESPVFRTAGFGKTTFFLLHLQRTEIEYDPYRWGDSTMECAHHHIKLNWDTLESGSNIDCQKIRSEF